MEAPYKYVMLHTLTATWPVVPIKTPFLVPVPLSYAETLTTIGLKVPVAVESTLDLHCRTMGTTKSEWVRRAILHLLAVEQEWLEQQKKEQLI